MLAACEAKLFVYVSEETGSAFYSRRNVVQPRDEAPSEDGVGSVKGAAVNHCSCQFMVKTGCPSSDSQPLS
jgi:hypothetical protein